MIGTLVSALVGREIGEDDGEGGTVGAVAGMAGFFLVKRLLPAAAFGVGVLIIKHYVEKFANE